MNTSSVLMTLLAAGLFAVPSETPASTGKEALRSQVIHIVDWEGSRLPPIYERSDQRPLSRDDIVALSSNGFKAEEIVRMIRERRYVGDASAQALIQLRHDGVPPGVVRAVSRHALPPNRSIRISLQIGLEGNAPDARGRYLYVIIPDGDIDRILTTDLGDIVAQKGNVRVDHSDPLVPRNVREVHLNGTVPIVTNGRRDIHIVTSSRPDIWSLEDIPQKNRSGIDSFPIDVPASSLNRDCRIRLRYRQDPLLPHIWNETAARLQCEWK